MPTIDADAHVIESERTWDYVENTKFRPQLATPNGGGAQYWMIDGKAFRRGVNVDRGLSEADREMRDIDARLRHMDELDIDVQVLYPSLFLRPLTAKPEVEKAICRSYNQWLIDICSKGRGRLQWIATVPMIDMDDAVEEIRFAKANGACGLFSRGLVGDKRLSHPFFYPLFEAAEKANLAFCVHASTGNFDWVELFDGESGFGRFKVPVLSAFHSIVYDTEFRRSFPSCAAVLSKCGRNGFPTCASRSAGDSSATTSNASPEPSGKSEDDEDNFHWACVHSGASQRTEHTFRSLVDRSLFRSPVVDFPQTENGDTGWPSNRLHLYLSWA
jgi:predicted TIM-barrel fold metal-dependent hydrolase